VNSKKLFSAERRLMQERGETIPAYAPAPAPAIHTQEVLNAIAEVKKMIEGLGAQATTAINEPGPEMSVLRGQLHDLKASIDKTKAEIAAIHKPGENEDKFVTAAMELGAIVEATEVATNNI